MMMGDPPYRIAYVIGELGEGGVEYQLHELLRHLDRRRFAPGVFLLASGGWWVEPIRALGVPVEEIPRRGPADLRRLAPLRAALRRFAPHVLHTILWSGNSYGRLAALGLAIPVVIAAERVVMPHRAWQMVVERALDRVTDAYLVNCEAVAAWKVERERVAREKIEVIPNGIDLGRLPPFSGDRRGRGRDQRRGVPGAGDERGDGPPRAAPRARRRGGGGGAGAARLHARAPPRDHRAPARGGRLLGRRDGPADHGRLPAAAPRDAGPCDRRRRLRGPGRMSRET